VLQDVAELTSSSAVAERPRCRVR